MSINKFKIFCSDESLPEPSKKSVYILYCVCENNFKSSHTPEPSRVLEPHSSTLRQNEPNQHAYLCDEEAWYADYTLVMFCITHELTFPLMDFLSCLLLECCL